MKLAIHLGRITHHLRDPLPINLQINLQNFLHAQTVKLRVAHIRNARTPRPHLQVVTEQRDPNPECPHSFIRPV